ncbi:MAG: hypothetical protein ACK559_37990, partial [bacterium]
VDPPDPTLHPNALGRARVAAVLDALREHPPRHLHALTPVGDLLREPRVAVVEQRGGVDVPDGDAAELTRPVHVRLEDGLEDVPPTDGRIEQREPADVHELVAAQLRVDDVGHGFLDGLALWRDALGVDGLGRGRQCVEDALDGGEHQVHGRRLPLGAHGARGAVRRGVQRVEAAVVVVPRQAEQALLVALEPRDVVTDQGLDLVLVHQELTSEDVDGRNPRLKRVRALARSVTAVDAAHLGLEHPTSLLSAALGLDGL